MFVSIALIKDQIAKKKYFILYLKITTGIMYNAQISFVLVRKPLGRRFLQDTISGKEIQSDVAQVS